MKPKIYWNDAYYNDVLPCSSDNACEIISDFLSDTPTKKTFYFKIDKTKKEIQEKERQLDELTIFLEDLKEDISYLKTLLQGDYNELWKNYGKYK